MDVFLEYLFEKKTTAQDVVKKMLLVLAAVLVCMVVIVVFSMLGQFFMSYVLLAIAAVVYGLVVLLRNFSLEYEYVFTNGDLDVDIVKGRKTRTRLTSLHCRQIQLMAPITDADMKRQAESDSISRRYNAVYDESQGGVYHVIYIRDGERLLLTWQPPRALLAAMKKTNPRVITIAPEDEVDA
ncbi:MAG: hypothetical protein E7402_03015 [Ruminococcaceae bacterium]|nr:hypothetical protein [Oscillospiraceae bacterium]